MRGDDARSPMRRAASSPTSRIGWRTVVSGGSKTLVLGHAHAAPAKRRDRAEGEQVALREDRRQSRRGLEQALRRAPSAVETPVHARLHEAAVRRDSRVA